VPNETSSQTLKKLEEWAKKETLSSNFLNFNRSLLHIQAEVERRVDVPEIWLSEKVVDNRMARGIPLLKFNDLAINWPLIEETFNRIATVFTDYPDLFGPIPEVLIKKEYGQRLTKKTAKAWFDGKSSPAIIGGEDINRYLLDSLIQQTLRPFLIKYSRALIELVNQDGWRRGYCPVCGGNPDIAFLEKGVGERWLMCSRCDSQWRFQRLECPSCGNQDAKKMSFLSDDEGGYRLYVCDNCKTYLKAVDLRKAGNDVYLPLERLLTFDMDRQGHEMGYQPGYTQIEGTDTTQP
jgi:FdhE protein